MNRNDLTGDGPADILVTSPWGLGLFSLTAGALVARTVAANGSRFGDWLLNTADNAVALRADMDGDGSGELLMASPWGIGVVKLRGAAPSSLAMVANGQRAGGWIVDTGNNRFLHAGDFDGNGRDEVLVTSPWGLGLLGLGAAAGGGLGTTFLAPNGSRFGDWLLNTGDNGFPVVADVDGDGRPEIVVTSPWGLGILKHTAAGLTSVVMVPNGTALGSWVLDTTRDRVELAADLDGDGRAELVLRNDSGLVVLRPLGKTLQVVASAQAGEVLGAWHFDALRDRVGLAADFAGTGHAEVLVIGDGGLAILRLVHGTLASRFVAPNGSRFGGWLLNTRDNRINQAVDVDGNHRAELVVSSPWGLGILRFNGSGFDALGMWPNGTRVGGWLLNTADNDLEAGLGRCHALLIWHPDWTGAVEGAGQALRRRGYAVAATQNAEDGLRQLAAMAMQLRPGDRAFVYLAGHGATNRSLSDHQRSSALLHVLQFGDGAIVGYDRFVPWLRRMAVAGVDLTVFDGSCDGGEAVMAALGERYLALSTTGVHAPGLTNTPDPSNLMGKAGRPNSFGLWWSAEPTASLMTSQAPHRFYQKIFRSDDTEVNELSLFYKPGITFYQAVGGGWDLMVRGCSLYRYVYPTEYQALSQAEKDTLTVGTEAYLSAMRADLLAFQPPILRLLEILSDAALVGRAADVYAAAYPRPWQTLFGDLAWNVSAEPVRHSPTGTPIEPRVYAGRSGFLQMVDDIQRTLAYFAQSYEEQERLLRALDAAVAAQHLARGVAVHARPRLPVGVTDYLSFNAYDRGVRSRLQQIGAKAQAPRMRVLTKLRATPMAHLLTTRFGRLMSEEWAEVQRHVPMTAMHPSIDPLVSLILAIQASDYRLVDHLFYTLTIAEEAISRASARGVETGELLSF